MNTKDIDQIAEEAALEISWYYERPNRFVELDKVESIIKSACKKAKRPTDSEIYDYLYRSGRSEPSTDYAQCIALSNEQWPRNPQTESERESDKRHLEQILGTPEVGYENLACASECDASLDWPYPRQPRSASEKRIPEQSRDNMSSEAHL